VSSNAAKGMHSGPQYGREDVIEQVHGHGRPAMLTSKHPIHGRAQ
jgi:hypothetical protein